MIKTSIVCWQPSVAFRPKKLNRPQRISTGPVFTKAIPRLAISTARRQNAKSWELRGATSLARLRRQQGRQQEAVALLSPILGWFKEGFDTADLHAR